LQQGLALGAVLLLHTARRDTTTLLRRRSSFDDLELLFLAFQVGGIAHRRTSTSRTGQEGANLADVDVKPPFTLR